MKRLKKKKEKGNTIFVFLLARNLNARHREKSSETFPDTRISRDIVKPIARDGRTIGATITGTTFTGVTGCNSQITNERCISRGQGCSKAVRIVCHSQFRNRVQMKTQVSDLVHFAYRDRTIYTPPLSRAGDRAS